MFHVQRILSLAAVAGLVVVAGCKKPEGATTTTDTTPPPATVSAIPSVAVAPDTTPTPVTTNTAGTQTTPLTGASGGSCAPEGAFGCSPDGIHEVHCVKGNWATYRTCRGPKHCAHDAHHTKCDYGPLMPGDVCAPPLESKCTADHKGVLRCSNGRLSVTETCPAGKTCKPRIGCD